MKKVLLFLIVLLGINLTSNAQLCEIRGGNGASVEVFSATIEEGGSMVYVTVSNDSNDISANVTVNVSVEYKDGSKLSFSGKDRALPNQNTVIKIPIKPKNGSWMCKSVNVDSITGSRCSE
ncbi:MAG: hypothetical protein E7067_08945 [Lentimicrobiaceae bacterium]|nr:hypothetical protein [Lentimicrobiaceae bacterium]